MMQASHLRIEKDVAWRPPVQFSFDGRRLTCPEGESLAVALYAAGLRTLRRAPVDGGPRGAFCFMGICQECVVVVDGRRIEACRVSVHDGLEAFSG